MSCSFYCCICEKQSNLHHPQGKVSTFEKDVLLFSILYPNRESLFAIVSQTQRSPTRPGSNTRRRSHDKLPNIHWNQYFSARRCLFIILRSGAVVAIKAEEAKDCTLIDGKERGKKSPCFYEGILIVRPVFSRLRKRRECVH